MSKEVYDRKYFYKDIKVKEYTRDMLVKKKLKNREGRPSERWDDFFWRVLGGKKL